MNVSSVHRSCLLLLSAVSGLLLGGCSDRSDDIRLSRSDAVFTIDGDTLFVDGHARDLFGIDAPELGQTCATPKGGYACGEEAAFELDKLILLDAPDCSKHDSVSGKFECVIPNGNLALFLLETGFVAVKPDAPSNYFERQNTAKDRGLGIWRGTYPDGIREMPHYQVDVSRLETRICPVFLVPRNDEFWYVTPTHPDYRKLQTSKSKDTRRFCSDDAARAAGFNWLPPKRSP